MNPFLLNRLIRSGGKYSVAALRTISGKQIRHGDLRMSDAHEVFRCPYAGRVCHYAKGLSFTGWFRVWFL